MHRLRPALVLGLLALLAPAPASAAAPWHPTPGQGWQWVLSAVPTAEQLAAYPTAKAWDVDGFDTPAGTVRAIRARGAGAVCYLSAGSFEAWRPDAASFPAAVKGRPLDGWAGERWLDVRQLSVLAPIMAARMAMCARKGFDAVEADNVDGYTNPTGFPLTAADQLAYARVLARTAHRLGLGIALKNDVEQVAALAGDFEWAVNEQCFEHAECSAYGAFRRLGKAVWVVEYARPTSAFCPQARAAGYDAMRKHLRLDAYRVAC